MGVLTIEREITTSVPPSTMFKIFVLENHIYLPKIVPHFSVEILEGNGGPGTIKKTTFGAEGSEFKYIKTKIEATDKENFSHSYSVIEADPKTEKLAKITMEIKMEASPNGGSIIKTCSKYYPKENCEVDEDIIKAKAEKAMGLYKVVDAYILANPDVCN
ncbi:major allergen Pru ar 1-like [Euphorbia lathyris]|uniref:major allergen Pru ar 1-like n=1 Tax=Euphorbia lathyris TaxID=212925 RepID=UPI0033136254